MRGVALVLLGVLSVAACDSSSDDQLSKEEYVEQANAAMCEGAAEIQERSVALFGDESAPPDDAALRGFADFVHDNVIAQVADAQAIGVPDSIKGEYAEFFADARAAAVEYKRRVNLDPSSVEAAEGEVFGPLSERAGALGLECV